MTFSLATIIPVFTTALLILDYLHRVFFILAIETKVSGN